MAAAAHGHTDAVRLLLEARAKHDLRDKDSRTPLQHAIRNEHKEIEALCAITIRLLHEGCSCSHCADFSFPSSAIAS